MYEIIDNNGVIYSSSDYEEIMTWWGEMTDENPENIEWDGDLKLIKILDIIK